MTLRSSLGHLLPEIFPIIASNLPLHITPPTLLSLALANRYLSEVVLPLLYSTLILKNEKDALMMIQRLINEPELGKAVRELHILIVAKSTNPFDIGRHVEELISAGKLPYIRSLGIFISRGPQYKIYEPIGTSWDLRTSFWVNLQNNCPRFRELVIRLAPGSYNVADDCGFAGIFELQNLTSLTLNLEFVMYPDVEKQVFFEGLRALSANLRTLNLQGLLEMPNGDLDMIPLSMDLSLNFPMIRSLTLSDFWILDHREAMDFWQRHPTLEYLDIATPEGGRWFSESPGLDFEHFLPNLKHFKGHYKDVQTLAPILHRLTGLSAYRTLDAQSLNFIPPNGLPNLRSLSTEQVAVKIQNTWLDSDSDTPWYRAPDNLSRSSRRTETRIASEYILTIAKFAPNLEELACFFSSSVGIADFANIAHEMAQLSKLSRFYTRGTLTFMSEKLAEHTKAIADMCRGLTVVVEMHNPPPCVAAKISRDERGNVCDIRIGEGYGVQIGREDKAFPI